MKAVRWTRFTWNAASLPTPAPAFPHRYTLRGAHREDLEAVKQVIFNAFAIDSAWSDAMATARDWLEHAIDAAFERESVPALVLQHGQRIIAASALNTEVHADTHLISGPCVLMEYHNRGIGSALLYYSLMQLGKAGLEEVSAVSKENVVVAKFIYPKFGSRKAAHVFEPGVTST